VNPERHWTLHNPTRVVFGQGALERVGEHASGRVLLVTSPGTTRRGLTGRVAEHVGGRGLLVHDRVESAPTVASLDASIRELRGERVDTIVAVGGGSSIDTAKVLSLALAGGGADARALADSATGPADVEPVRLIAVPTTAGTGSEVTPFATVWDDVERRKLSVGSSRLFPAVALVDPLLAASLDWEGTLGPGLDACVQCFEAIWNRNGTPVTTALAERGLSLVPDALRELRTDAGAMSARERMAEAALLSGLAISQTRTALAHSMSYPLTSRLGLPHGLACALVLPAVLEHNIAGDDGRLGAVARSFGLGEAADLVPWVIALYRELDVAEAVRRYAPRLDALEKLAPEMLVPERAANNLRLADEDDVRRILRRTASFFESGVVV
jgi:alcohol dehydrogenase